jgi:hypothetical protein
MEQRDKIRSAAGPGATSKNIEDRLTSARAPNLKKCPVNCVRLGTKCTDNHLICSELISCGNNVTPKR